MKTKFTALLIIVIFFGPFFLLSNNKKYPLPVSNSPALSTHPGAERAPSRDSCPFELYYGESTGVLEILFLNEVDYISYCIKNQSGLILESASLESFIDGEHYLIPMSFSPFEQYTIEITCNYGVFWSFFRFVDFEDWT